MYECNDKMVSHPDHYQSETGLEVIDVIEAFTFDLTGIEAVDTGNALKYLCRWKKKNGLQDLKKAMWYLQNLIDHVEKLEMENQYIQNDIQITKDLVAELKRKEVMEGFEPKLVVSRWRCNHCRTLLEIDGDKDVYIVCGAHMGDHHPECPLSFELDFTQLDAIVAYTKIKKEND